MVSETLGPPYGPPANLAVIFAAWRDRGLPAVVDRAWFERIGLSGNLSSRNLHALRFLRLVDDAHRPTEIAERLRIAPADEFESTLAAIVRTSYAKAWSIRPPVGESRVRIEDAFRHESPPAQRRRMVACFIGLCTLAGIPHGAALRERMPHRPYPRTARANPMPDASERRDQPHGASASSGISPDGTAQNVSGEASRDCRGATAHDEAAAGRRGERRTTVTRPAPDVLGLLLTKFPDFDPAWPDALKEKWFDAFSRLHADLTRHA